MNGALLWPALAVIAVAALAGHSESGLHPRRDLWGRSLLAGAAILSGLSLVIAPSVGLAIALRYRLAPDAVCAECASAARVHPLIGGAAVVATIVALVRLVRVVRQHRRATLHGPTGRITILETSEPLAYAVPRHGGCVVVSTGMLEALDGRERQVVFAHERAHLRQNHHRHLFVAACAEALLPFLAPLAKSVRLATERCADEAAVVAMSGDRRVVASAILRAALHTNTYERQLMSFGGGSILRRVTALEGDTPALGSPSFAVRLGAGLAAAGIVLTLTAQTHHVAVVALQLCSI